MPDLNEDIRLPVACPECGSHLFRVARTHNVDDPVRCASCKHDFCRYHDALTFLRQGPGSESEALLETVVNRPAR